MVREKETKREREIGRKRERNCDMRDIDLLPPIFTPIGNRIHNLGMFPDWKSNPQPGVQKCSHLLSHPARATGKINL